MLRGWIADNNHKTLVEHRKLLPEKLNRECMEIPSQLGVCSQTEEVDRLHANGKPFSRFQWGFARPSM